MAAFGAMHPFRRQRLGAHGVAGVELAITHQLGFGAEAGYTLIPGVPYASLRAVVSYNFRNAITGRQP